MRIIKKQNTRSPVLQGVVQEDEPRPPDKSGADTNVGHLAATISDDATPLTDAELITLYLRGRAHERFEEAFADLIDRHYHVMAGIIGNCLLAANCPPSNYLDDIVQEVCMTLVRKLPTFDLARPFAPWLAGITARTTQGWLAKYGRKWCRQTKLDKVVEPTDERRNPADELALCDQADFVIERASERDAELLTALRETHGDKAEAAARLGCGVRNLEIRMKNCARRLGWVVAELFDD